ncbi:hypothetical protein Dimus_005747 [Dionaea muscipula]
MRYKCPCRLVSTTCFSHCISDLVSLLFLYASKLLKMGSAVDAADKEISKNVRVIFVLGRPLVFYMQ